MISYLFWMSLSIIISRSTHVSANGIISFLLMTGNIPLHICAASSLFLCDGHLGCFCVLAFVNSAAMNTGVHVSFQILVFSGYMPKSGIAGLHGSSIF